MKKKLNYFQYEEKAAVDHLKKLDNAQTFKMGLEISEFAIKTFYDSILNQYPALSRKAATDKFRALMRNI